MRRGTLGSIFWIGLFLAAPWTWADPVLSTHPRIYLTPDHLALLRQRAALNTDEWNRFINAYNGARSARDHYLKAGAIPDSHLVPLLALAYQVTEDRAYAEAGIAALTKLLNQDLTPGGSFSKMGQLVDAMITSAIGFDWFYDQLTSDEKRLIIGKINHYTAFELQDPPYPWHNRGIDHMVSIGLSGYATYGDNPHAQTLIDHARKERFDKLLEGMNRLFGEGGGWVEGDFYGFDATPRLLQYVEVVKTATGEDLYTASPWFKDRLSYRLGFDYPGTFYDNNYGKGVHYDGTFGEPFGKPYFGYYNSGDAHKGMAGMTDGARLEKLLLIKRFSPEPAARQLQWLISQPPRDQMLYTGHNEWLDFLWFNPDQPKEPPTRLAHYAPGVGIVTLRSDWSEDATWILFKCGDIFSASHQHLDQNSFSIFKKGDLAIKSGLYDGDGAYSPHVVNYYTRTIASNSVLVYDPKEQFGPWRGLHYPEALNDGGQRANRGDNQEYNSVEHWLQFKDRQDTGDIIHYEHTEEYTYVYGDATNAYNNPRYVAPKEGMFQGRNRPKVSLFTRELVYLRPDTVVVFDRVNAMEPSHQKKWLLHFLNRPVVTGKETVVSSGEYLYDGDLTIAAAGEGKLFTKTLLPDERQIRRVGGRGIKDYWVFGKNLAPGRGMSNWGDDYGEWRIEVEPTRQRRDDLFLHVLYVSDPSVSLMPAATRIDTDSGDRVGAQIDRENGAFAWVVLFSKNKGSISEVRYQTNRASPIKHLLLNMKPEGNYEIRQKGHLLEIKKASRQGVLFFQTELIKGGAQFQVVET